MLNKRVNWKEFSKGTIYRDVGRRQKPQGTGKCPRTSDRDKLLPGPGLKGQEWGLLAEQETTQQPRPRQTAAQPGKLIHSPVSRLLLPARLTVGCVSLPRPNQKPMAKVAQVIQSLRANLLGFTGRRWGRGSGGKQICPPKMALASPVPKNTCQGPLTCVRPGPTEQTASWLQTYR